MGGTQIHSTNFAVAVEHQWRFSQPTFGHFPKHGTSIPRARQHPSTIGRHATDGIAVILDGILYAPVIHGVEVDGIVSGADEGVALILRQNHGGQGELANVGRSLLAIVF